MINPTKFIQPHLGIFSSARIWKVFKFCAAHHLKRLPEGHPCLNVHGHNFKLTVFCCGLFNTDIKRNGMVVEFATIKEVVQPIVDTENVAQWLYFMIKEHLPELEYVELQETDSCGAQFPAFREYRSHSK